MIKIFCDKKEKDIKNFWNHIVFHPTNAIEHDWGKQHLDRMAEDKAVQIVRIYSMFEQCVTLDANGEMQYDFSVSDYRIDYLLRKGFTPYLAYAFFPKFLAAEQDEALISKRYNGDYLCRTYMTDYSKWEEICRVYTRHIVDRYGEDTVSQWYLQCYNEPDLQHFFYWNAPTYQARAAEYCKLYDAFVAGVTSVSQKLTIGGVALSESATHFDFLEYFLNHVRKCGVRLDFLSYHSYGTSPSRINDGSNPLDIKGALHNTMMVKRVAALCGFGDIPMICDEWGASTDGYYGTDRCSKLIFRENEQYAAYFAKMLTYYDERGVYDPQLLCLSGAHNLKTDFGGHRNFFTKSFYPKAIYNAFVLAARLGTQKLYHYADLTYEDISIMPTKHADGHMSILLSYADDLFLRELPDKQVEIALQNITGKYRVTLWRIDREHANPYPKYLELGSPQTPAKEQLQQIRDAGALREELLADVSPEDPVVRFSMENNATVLVELVAVV